MLDGGVDPSKGECFFMQGTRNAGLRCRTGLSVVTPQLHFVITPWC